MWARSTILFSVIFMVSGTVTAQIPEPGAAPVPPEPKTLEAPPAALPPARATPEAPPAAEKPKSSEKPQPPASKPVVAKPVEAPRVQEQPARRPPAAAAVPVKEPPTEAEEPPASATPPTPAFATPGVAAARTFSFGCIALSFAMLIIGIAAGFAWRHLASRRKLGGMHVRIGTWRGIP